MSWFSKIFSKFTGQSLDDAAAKQGKIVDPGFDIAFRIVLEEEGGYSDHKNDRGGATNYGVTQKTYDHWRKTQKLEPRAVREITRDEVKAIYYVYWKESKAPTLPLASAIAVFDMAINSGAARAAKYWATSGGDLDRFFKLREDFYRGIVAKDSTQKVFLKGWLNRLNRLRKKI